MATIKILLTILSIAPLLSCVTPRPSTDANLEGGGESSPIKANRAPLLAIPDPTLEAIYSYSINSAYKGTYRVRYSAPFQFNNDSVFTVTSTSDNYQSARIYRLADHAFLGTIIDARIHMKAEPYELVYSLNRQTHHYLWHDYGNDKTYPVNQHLSFIETSRITFNQREFVASETQSLYIFDQQQWLRRTIWLNEVGIIYSQHIQHNDSIEYHQLITLERRKISPN